MGIGIASILMLCAVSFDSQQRQETALQKPGSVAGVVVENKSDEPVRKAHVILRHDQGPGIGTTTDATGNFTLHNLEPGSYTVTVRRDGYVFAPEGRRQVLTVKAGEPISDLKLKLVRAGAISGRIVDADGDPITGASVQVLPWRPKRTVPNSGTYATTNDRGEYRAFNIAPGDYRVSVTYSPESQNIDVRLQRSTGGDGRSDGETYPTAYYPGTVDARQAAVVTLEPGTELQGVDVQLIRARGVQVRGRVTGLAGSSLTPFFLMVALEPVRKQGQAELGQSRNTMVRDPKGEFEFADVLPGTYRVAAMSDGFNGENKLTARQTLEVGESDIDGIQLNMGRPRKVSGRIIIPEGRKVSSGLMIILGSREPADTQGGGMAHVSAAGSFSMNDVPPGDYEVILASTSASDDLYVSAIRLGNTDVLAEGIQVGEGPLGSLDIVLKANGGTAECVVTSETGEAVPQARVILVPDAPRQRQVALYGDCRTEANGTCTIMGISPGEYHAYAFPTEIEMDYRDPDALKPLAKYGTAVRLGEGERLHLELKSAPVE